MVSSQRSRAVTMNSAGAGAGTEERAAVEGLGNREPGRQSACWRSGRARRTDRRGQPRALRRRANVRSAGRGSHSRRATACRGAGNGRYRRRRRSRCYRARDLPRASPSRRRPGDPAVARRRDSSRPRRARSGGRDSRAAVRPWRDRSASSACARQRMMGPCGAPRSSPAHRTAVRTGAASSACRRRAWARRN